MFSVLFFFFFLLLLLVVVVKTFSMLTGRTMSIIFVSVVLFCFVITITDIQLAVSVFCSCIVMFYVSLYGRLAGAEFEGSQPEWSISSMIYSRDTPFWSGTLEAD